MTTLFFLLMRASAKEPGTLVTKLKGGPPGCEFTECVFTEAKPLVMKPKCCFTSTPEGAAPLPPNFLGTPRGSPNVRKTHLKNRLKIGSGKKGVR